MGQTSSRHHESSTRPTSPTSTPSTSTNPVAGANADPHSNTSVDADLSTSDGSGSRRSSLRKSILKYMKPSGVRNRLGGVVSNQPREAGRSWRRSRQCFNAPLDSSTLPLDSRLASSSNSLADNSVDLLPPDKGKQREITLPSDDGEDCTTDSAGDADQALQLSNATTMLEQSAAAITSTSSSSHAVDDTFVDPPIVSSNSCHDIQISDESDSGPPIQDSSPVYEWESDENVTESEPQAPPSPQQSNDSPVRPFPPPGTLVVVQGIVHTTDVSRNGSSPSASHSPQENTTPTPPSPLPPSGVEFTSEQSRSRARNRLSALLRPQSASSRSRSISMNDSMPAVVETAPPEVESATVSPSVSQASQAESSHGRDNTLDLNEQSDTSNGGFALGGNAASSVTENQPPSISSSSIDVLGTLLSVAAAATAASLLTGSSEPILSSGLAPPGSNPPVPSPPNPLSPPHSTSTSLPNLPPYPSFPSHNAGIPDITAAGRAERMRQAWSTIRERLGLRPSTPQPGSENMNGQSQDNGVNNATPSLLNADGTTSGAPTDTRELMLAEMARAFNIGLGLNGLSGITPNAGAASASDDRNTATATQNDFTGNRTAPAEPEGNIEARTGRTPGNPSVTMPPEGSFERFLVDLQIDLRAALTQTEDEVDNNHERQRQSQNMTSLGLSTTNVAGPSDSEVSPSSTVPLPAASATHPLHESGGNQIQNTEFPVSADNDPYAEMPPLQEVSDSESEFDEDDHEGNFGEDDEFHSADHGSTNAASPNESSNVPNHTPSLGSGHIDASGRINWWRLYRFPPVPSPRTGSRQLSSLTSQSASSPLEPGSMSDPVPAEAAPGNEPSIDALHTDTLYSNSVPLTLPSSPPSSSVQGQNSVEGAPLSQIPLHAVVPVIVVGLQSVNQDWRHDIPPHGTNENLDFIGQPSAEDSVNGFANENPDHDEFDSLGVDRHGGLNATQGGGDGQRGSGRARGWHSRAANAIRNLRPGRRNAETGSDVQVPLMAPGSRTFLIYVIGGYYPPDHNIVTGGPNILDSFEALLELADLLGQVKPPTVSKDDIEKSGLKIVNASELGQLEKQGEVASNCLDRCLICLDDYDAEDPIRIMSCRHAFHKGCVDEWLQKGRNNCPACRSTGVTTDSHSTPPMPTPAS